MSSRSDKNNDYYSAIKSHSYDFLISFSFVLLQVDYIPVCCKDRML